MKFSERPCLGERVFIKNRLVRNRVWQGGRSQKISWEDKPIESVVGIYAGYRVIQNGVLTIPGNYDESACFTISSTITCAIVIINERKNPVRVGFDSMELVQDTYEQ